MPSKRKVKKEPPIDCDCLIPRYSINGYCKMCGGYLPEHPQHKNNYKKAPSSLELEGVIMDFHYKKGCGWILTSEGLARVDELASAIKKYYLDNLVSMHNPYLRGLDKIVYVIALNDVRKMIEEG